MSNVYYKKINSESSISEIQDITKELFDKIVIEEKIVLSGKMIPLKVHFGEAGNITYLKSENYEGIIDHLKNKKIETCFIETN